MRHCNFNIAPHLSHMTSSIRSTSQMIHGLVHELRCDNAPEKSRVKDWFTGPRGMQGIAWMGLGGAGIRQRSERRQVVQVVVRISIRVAAQVVVSVLAEKGVDVFELTVEREINGFVVVNLFAA